MTDLAAALLSAGIIPTEHGDWRHRGIPTLTPQAIVLHHTAGAIGHPVPSLNVVLNGRTGIPGPLCNILIGRDASVHLIAAGKANHAGRNSRIALDEATHGLVTVSTRTAQARKLVDDTVGNSVTWGIEIEHSGTAAEPWTEAVLDMTARVCAALCRAQAWTPGHVTLHRNLTARKIDPFGSTDWWARTAQHLEASRP